MLLRVVSIGKFWLDNQQAISMLLIFCSRGAEWEEEIYGAETGDTVKERKLPRLCAPAT
jgi:hypothetical protein